MFSKMIIWFCLGLMMVGIGVFVVIVGVLGFIGMQYVNICVQDGYVVQLVGIVVLVEFDFNFLSFCIVFDCVVMVFNVFGMEKMVECVKMFFDKFDVVWKCYCVLFIMVEECKLVDEVQGLCDVFVCDGVQVLM